MLRGLRELGPTHKTYEEQNRLLLSLNQSVDQAWWPSLSRCTSENHAAQCGHFHHNMPVKRSGQNCCGKGFRIGKTGRRNTLGSLKLQKV